MKKRYLIICLLLVSLIMTSCSNDKLAGDGKAADNFKGALFAGEDKKELEEVERQARNYFDNYLKGNYEEAYELLSDKEKDVMLLEEFKPEFGDTGHEGYDKIVNKIESLAREYSTYTIENISMVEDYYEVEILQNLLDRTELFGQLPRNGVVVNVDVSMDLLNNIESIDELPMVEVETKLKLIKENSEFKIDLGKYDGLKKAEEDLKIYGDNIEIIDEELNRYSDSAFVTGLLKNNGDKSINYVMLRIKYLDKEGNVLYEETNSSYMADVDKTIIMKPNYISNFIFSVPKRLLSEWKDDYELEIVGVSILDEGVDENQVNESSVDESLKEKIEIDYDINMYNDNTFINGRLINNSDENINLAVVKIYYMDNNDEAILEDIAVVFLKDSNFNEVEIPSGSEGEFILVAPEDILELWSKKIKVEVVGLE